MNGASEEMIIELRFPACPDRMALVRSAVRGATGFCGLDKASTQEIVLAVGEACQNVMQHGYAGQEPGDIVLTVARREGGLVIRVIDYSPHLDVNRIRPRDYEDIRPGGLGVHFIQEIMDSAVFRPGENGVGNVLEMTKRIGATP